MTRTPGRVGATWFTLFTLAWLALWTVQLTPLQLLIPLQLNTPDDADGWISGVVSSGLVLAAGGIAGVIAGPVAGGLSDRTRGGFGRRRPWALAGVALATVSLVGIAFAQGPWGVGIAWVGVSVGTAVASAAFTALIADQLTSQRGTASAAVSSSQALGIVVGVGVIVLLELGIVVGYLVLAGFLAVVGVAAALLLPDPAVPAQSRAARTVRTFSDRIAALRDRDFAWLLAGRLTVNVGNALGTGLLLFFLLYGLHRDAAVAEDELLLLIVVYTVFVVAASVIAGWYSDRTGRRVGIVVASAIVQGVASLVLAAIPSLETAMVAAALLGIGYGAYMAVGLALGTDLLPFPEDHARDLGFVNVSASLGQLLGPLIGAGLVALVGGFWLLFAVGGVLSIAGGFMTLAIRRRTPVAAAA
ncbi:MFS transporter [Microbacterium fluvii]|uniref:MFS transporter n=1 Tax=Microbacterium fluvii TaxID=415215 RepID=A0ABW2HCS6_9MICO|nr:MFS transporter [Microbacterium fluvii]MCU4671898.1 MFS transporter [Microbacterium fluvii]